MASEILHGGLAFLRIDGQRVADVHNVRYQRTGNNRPHHPIGHAKPKEIVRLAEQAVRLSFDVTATINHTPQTRKIYPKQSTSLDIFNHPAIDIVLESEIHGEVIARITGFQTDEESGEFMIEDITYRRYSGQAVAYFDGDEA